MINDDGILGFLVRKMMVVVLAGRRRHGGLN